MRILLFFLAVVGAEQAPPAEDWTKATTFPALNLNGLSVAQKTTLLKLLREEPCNCGCGMKVAECRIKDPACKDSRTLAAIAAREIKSGKTAVQVKALLHDPKFVKASRDAMLSEPVELSIAGAPFVGPANAPVTIVEFSDFQCPYCKVAAKNVGELQKMFPTQVKLVFKQYPLESHSAAELAAQASLAAHAQGKFWPFHDKLFSDPKSISSAKLAAWASEVGLDMKRYVAEMNARKYFLQVNKEKNEGINAGVGGTPTFFINGRQWQDEMDPALVKPAIEAELKRLGGK